MALTAALLFLPGLLVGLAAGARLVVAVGAAPVVSFGLVTVVSRITTATGLPWQPVTFLVATVVLALGAVALRLALRRTGAGERLLWRTQPVPAAPIGRQAAVLVAGAVAALVGTGTAIWGIGSALTATNQGFDALFHVNAVTLITETKDADPSAVIAVNHFTEGSSYYPDGFHALAALVADFGINSVVATNALVAAVPAMVAFGLMALLWELGLPRHACVAPFIGISATAFPTDIMWRGPIWPFAVGLALVPAMVALLVSTFENRSRAMAGLAVLGAAGVLLVHPSAALAAGVFAGAYFVQRWATRRARLLSDVVPLAVISGLVVVVAFPAVLTALTNSGNGANYDWPAVQNPGEAAGELLLFNYAAPLPQVWLFVLLVIGLAGIRSLRRASWWPAAGALFGVLTVLSAAYEGHLVAVLTGPWWNDRFRFAAMTTLGLGLLATHGVVVLADLLTAAARRVADAVGRREAGPAAGELLPPPRRRVAAVRWIALAAVLVSFGVLSNGYYSEYNRSRMQMQFAPGAGGSVTAPELEAMAQLATLVGPGEVVMNDPSDGSAWMWAMHGVRPMFGQAVLTPPSPALEPDQDRVLSRFNCLDSDPAVRDVVAEYRMRYAYVGDGFIIPTMQRAAGLRGLSEVASLELVFDNGGAQIYRIDEQPLTDSSADTACQAPAEGAGG